MQKEKFVTDVCTREFFTELKEYVEVPEVGAIENIDAKVFSVGGVLFLDDESVEYVGLIEKVPAKILCRKCKIIYSSDLERCPSCRKTSSSLVRENTALNIHNLLLKTRADFNRDKVTQKKLMKLHKTVFGVNYKEVN